MFELTRRIASITKWAFSKNWDCPKISYKCHVFFISYLLLQYYLLPGAAAFKLCLSMISNIQSSRYRKKQHKIVWRFEACSKKQKIRNGNGEKVFTQIYVIWNMQRFFSLRQNGVAVLFGGAVYLSFFSFDQRKLLCAIWHLHFKLNRNYFQRFLFLENRI